MSLARIPIPHCRATIDGKDVTTVSYNWSSTAESRNDENTIMMVDLGKLSPTEATISYIGVFAKIFMVMRAPT
jgi:phosphatidylserine/phosphatidylglycerophosphate/cardiolipin synthase-like enzyme